MTARRPLSDYDRTRLRLTVLIVLVSIGLGLAGYARQHARETAAVTR